MPLEWTHDQTTCPARNKKRKKCTGDTDCEQFPTISDRCQMARAAFDEYSESDGTPFVDFVRDVLILAHKEEGWTLQQMTEAGAVAFMIANEIPVPESVGI